MIKPVIFCDTNQTSDFHKKSPKFNTFSSSADKNHNFILLRINHRLKWMLLSLNKLLYLRGSYHVIKEVNFFDKVLPFSGENKFNKNNINCDIC